MIENFDIDSKIARRSTLPKASNDWPGAHPYLQGQLAADEKKPRKCEQAYADTPDKDFERLWLQGYDDEVDAILKREFYHRERLKQFTERSRTR